MNFFCDWLRQQSGTDLRRLPLTHVTKGYSARKVIHKGRLDPSSCSVMNEALVYTFYGRVAYRVSGDGTINLEGMCPICFVLSGDLIARSRHTHPFDSGAYAKRLYKHVFAEELNLTDFAISGDAELPDTLIKTFFKTRENYFLGDTSKIPAVDEIAPPGEMEVRAYHELITSAGRNEPDDRIYSIEVAFSDPIPLEDSLIALIVPHTLWSDDEQATWLQNLQTKNTEICTYEYHPGRSAEHYHAHLELELRRIFQKWKFFDED